MLEHLFSPFQSLHRWLENNPGVRNGLSLFLLSAAALAPWPAWALDLWVLLAWGGAFALAALLLLVGPELEPGEAMRALPGFLRRLTLHRLALSLAITKAILLGTGAGSIVEWVAQHGMRGHVGVGLAAVATLLIVHVSLGRPPVTLRFLGYGDSLSEQLAYLDGQRTRGDITPSQAREVETALRAEFRLTRESQEVGRLMVTEAWVAGVAAAAVLLAGLVAGVAFKAWPLSLTLTAYTVFTLAELVITAIPALVFSLVLNQWLTNAAENLAERSEAARVRQTRPDTGIVMVEMGRELASHKRLPSEVSQMVKTRAGRELGLHVSRIEFVASPHLNPRGYRVVLRGVSWASEELATQAGAAEFADAVWRCVRSRAGDLLTLEVMRELLTEAANTHPAAVAESIARFGWVKLHGLFQLLLNERVPLRDVVSLLEATWASGDASTPPDQLLANVRQRLALVVSLSVADENGTISLYQLSSDWLPALNQLEAEPWLARDLAQAASAALNASRRETWGRVSILVPRQHRARVALMLQQTHPDLAVVCAEELSPHYGLRVMGVIERRIKDLTGTPVPLLKLSSA